MQFKIKAGRFIFDKQTKKVKVSKQKGLIHVVRNADQETHFKWANLQTHIEQLDLIVFASDAVFENVVDKNNTFVLRFGMDDERYFFWLQEKCQTEKIVKEINRLINYEQPQFNESAMKDESHQQKQQPDKPSKNQHSQPLPQPLLQPDFVARITQGLTAAKKTAHTHHKEPTTALTHLSDVITSEALSTIIKQLENADSSQKFIQFMPQQHKDKKFIPSTLRSPQFLQAMDALSDALNSQNVLPLFMELGLNQEFLRKHYGIQAFLLALVDKYKGQKVEQKMQDQGKQHKKQQANQEQKMQ